MIFIKDNHKHVEKFKHFSEASFKETIKKVLIIFSNYRFWAASLIGASIFIPINVLGSLWGATFIQHKLQISQSLASHLNATLFVGAALGYAVFGIIAAFTTRLRLMLTLSLVFSILIMLMILFIDLTETYFVCLYTLLGVMAGPQAVTFTIAKVISPPGTSGSSTAGVNMINNLFAVILLPVIGYVLTYVTTHLDDGYNNIIDFQYALSLVIIILLVCIPLSFTLPKNIDV